MKKLLVILLVLGLAAPAMAADWYWYGTVRTHLSNYTAGEYYYGGPTNDSTISGLGNEDGDSGLFVNMAGQATTGARLKVNDKLSGQVEFGLTNAGLAVGDDQYDPETVYLRGAYGKYKMGEVVLLIGKWYTPATFLLYSGMTGDLGDMGDAIGLTTMYPYAGRRAQIRVSVANFEAALIEHVIANGTNEVIAGTDDDGNSVSYEDADFTMPKIELAYQWNSPMISLRPILGYQSFSVEDGDDSETITSMLYGLGVNVRLGQAKINLTYSNCTNPGNYGIKNVAPVAVEYTVASYTADLLAGDDPGTSATLLNLTRAALIDGDVEDASMTQMSLVVNYKVNKMVSIEGGYAMIKTEQAYTADIDVDQSANIYYLNVPITVGPGMTITPEYGQLDRGTVNYSDDVALVDLVAEDTADEIDAGTMSWLSVRFNVAF
jgi:hypothetical protein